jgi:hypothetical protein
MKTNTQDKYVKLFMIKGGTRIDGGSDRKSKRENLKMPDAFKCLHKSVLKDFQSFSINKI